MNLFLGLVLLCITSLASLISNNRQNEFIEFLREGNDGGVMEYLELYPDEIDPSVHNGEPIVLACLAGNLKLLRVLLKHPLVTPNVRGGSPMMICINLNRRDCLTELLKDGRAALEPLNRLFVPKDFDIIWFIWSLTNPVLEACWKGQAEVIKKLNLSRLGHKQFDILFARARNHPAALKSLQIWMLRAIGLPRNDERDAALCTFMDKLPSMPTKRLRLFIKHRVALELVCKEPHKTAPVLMPEIADLISLRFYPDLNHVPVVKIYPSAYLAVVLVTGLMLKQGLYLLDLPEDPHYCLMLGINLAMGRYYFWRHLPLIKWKSNFIDIMVIDMATIIIFIFFSTYLYLFS